ncbi:MAG TPA: DUF1588 domain-containing protein [Polyangiaceae bacterium]|nr:DUF1588 domain-containing protein [Polyangiaceae bacterium]
MAQFTTPFRQVVVPLLASGAALLVGCTASIASPGNETGASGGSPSSASAAGAAAVGGASVTPGAVAASAVVPSGMRRLTATQYRATLFDLFGADVTAPQELDPDDSNARFVITGSYRVTTGPKGVAKYEQAALDVAKQVFASPALKQKTLGCDPAQVAACAATFVQSFGRRAWRRPLTNAETQRYTKLATDAAAAGAAPDESLSAVLQALLQSPHFLYMPEVGESVAGIRRLTSYETATRLAFLLTEAPPDAELAAAADQGELSSAAGVARQVSRLMALPSSHGSLTGFWGQLFGLRELDDITKSTEAYPQATPALLQAMHQEFDALIEQNVFVERGAALDIFDAESPVSDPGLALLYGHVPERIGVLTTGAWLSIQAKPDRTSPTLRGVWVRERLLCQSVPPPPPDVNNALLDPPKPGDAGERAKTTTRQKLEMHRANPTCASCHGLFDPIGVAFEHFDGIGAYRTSENGEKIDTSGSLDGKAFADARELGLLLKADPRVPDCLVQNLLEFVGGHDNLVGAPELVQAMAASFRERPDYVELVQRMLNSDWFVFPAAPL